MRSLKRWLDGRSGYLVKEWGRPGKTCFLVGVLEQAVSVGHVFVELMADKVHGEGLGGQAGSSTSKTVGLQAAGLFPDVVVPSKHLFGRRARLVCLD